MTRHDHAYAPAPQGRGMALTLLVGGILLLLVAGYLTTQSGGVLQHMAPLVWWGILGFLAVLGVVLLVGGSLLLRSVSELQRQFREGATSFMESSQSTFRGSGLSLENFKEQVEEGPESIGVAGLRPRPFEGVDPDADQLPPAFTDSQLSADRGFRTSEPARLGPASAPAPLETAPLAPTPAAPANFAPAESTTASQFGSLPTAPAAFVARPGASGFERGSPEPGLANAEFWTPALEGADPARYVAMIDRLFSQAGFVTQHQALSTPGLAAIWLFSRSHLGAPASLVLCEHRSAEGPQAWRLEELREVMGTHQIRRGQFATTSPVDAPLQALAAQSAINLLDIPRLLTTISKRKPEQQGELWRLLQGQA